jgi:hypothetical protein
MTSGVCYSKMIPPAFRLVCPFVAQQPPLRCQSLEAPQQAFPYHTAAHRESDSPVHASIYFLQNAAKLTSARKPSWQAYLCVLIVSGEQLIEPLQGQRSLSQLLVRLLRTQTSDRGRRALQSRTGVSRTTTCAMLHKHSLKIPSGLSANAEL